MEKIKEIESEIQACLHKGYNISELKPMDRADLDGFIWAIYSLESAFDNLECFMDKTITGKIKQEYAQEVYEEVYTSLICDACDLVYSHMDSYEEDAE